MKILFSHFISFKFSRNWNFLFVTGFLLFITLFIQSFSGLVISLGANNYYFILRTVHSMTASLIMFITYLHFYKSIYYRVDVGLSDRNSFLSGILVFIFLFITAFTGYVLPWGQMSYWGTKVITNFFDLIPFFGYRLKLGFWGDISISFDITRSRFFSIHFFLGLFSWVFIFFHIFIVHSKKSLTIPLSSLEDSNKVLFLYPNAYIKDLFFASILVLFYSIYFSLDFFFFDEFLNNCFVTTEVTPFEMAPEWYFLPSFSVLKYFENKVLGVFFSVLVIFIIFLTLFIKRL